MLYDQSQLARLECVRFALDLHKKHHDTSMQPFTAKDVAASARILERFIVGKAKPQTNANALNAGQYQGGLASSGSVSANYAGTTQGVQA